MALQQSIDLALESNIGGGGLPQTALDEALELMGGAMKRLAEDDASGRLPLLHMPHTADDLASIREAAAFLRDDATDVVILGVGGSSLGGQTLAQLKDYAVPGVGRFTESPRIHFLDNLDPITFDRVLHKLPLSSTKWVSISKSGGTGETLMQTIAVLTALEKAGLHAHPKDVFLGLSEPRKDGAKNALRDLLEPEDVRFLEHHTGIGGRYSVLTLRGPLPAPLPRLDLYAILQGAAVAYLSILQGNTAMETSGGRGAFLNAVVPKTRKG